MMDPDRTTRRQRKRLAFLRRHEGVMSLEHRIRLIRWHRRQRRDALLTALGPHPAPVWCVVANVVVERPYGPRGAERRRGTKHFVPEAKVYVLKPLWDWFPYGGGMSHLMVIGRARKTHRSIAVVVRSTWLTNWRVQLVYSPHIIRAMVRVAATGGYDSLREIVHKIPDQETPTYWNDPTPEAVLTKKWVWDGTAESKRQAEHVVSTMRAAELSRTMDELRRPE